MSLVPLWSDRRSTASRGWLVAYDWLLYMYIAQCACTAVSGVYAAVLLNRQKQIESQRTTSGQNAWHDIGAVITATWLLGESSPTFSGSLHWCPALGSNSGREARSTKLPPTISDWMNRSESSAQRPLCAAHLSASDDVKHVCWQWVSCLQTATLNNVHLYKWPLVCSLYMVRKALTAGNSPIRVWAEDKGQETQPAAFHSHWCLTLQHGQSTDHNALITSDKLIRQPAAYQWWRATAHLEMLTQP